MRRERNFSAGVLVFSCILVLIVIVAETSGAEGKSVYVVRHDYSYDELLVFAIDGEQLLLQKTVDINFYGLGAIDIAIDPQSETLFICYEYLQDTGGGDIIEMYSSKTLEYVGTAELVGPSDITGLVFDSAGGRLLATDRNTKKLWLIDWDGETMTLETNPEHVELDGIDYACGLEINGDLLYVTRYGYPSGPYGEHVFVYDISNDFQQHESIAMGNSTVSIAYNATDDTIYGGAYGYAGSYHHLIKRILDPNETIEKDTGVGVIGIDTDDDTGLVYLTTYREVNEQEGAIEVWDTSGWTAEPNQVIEPEFIYANDNEDGVIVTYLAGLAIGGPYKPELMEVWKKDVDNPQSVEPGDYITYLISFRSKDENSHSNVYVTDTLPNEVTYISADPNQEGYNLFTHTYTWYFNEIPGYDPNDPSDPNTYVELTVQVTEMAEPTSLIVNNVEVESDTSYVCDTEETLVACWGGDIIYVDKDAPGYRTGVDWMHAYNDLQRALLRADACDEPSHEHQIWVADGTYKPGTNYNDTFEVPDSVEVYGGFAGCGASDPNERDWKKYKTTLSGFISDTPYPQRNETVVTMGDETILDGFTVTEGDRWGIYSEGVYFSLANCNIIGNEQRGIYCLDSDATIQWCQINDNTFQGIYHEGSDYLLYIENCKIHGNLRDGIETYLSILEIKNSMVYDNGSGEDYYGINLLNSSTNPTIRNNTIVHNVNAGIKFTGNNYPNVYNCIVYYNDEEGDKMQLENIDETYYCCIYDPNDPNGLITTPDGNGNITCKPDFAYDTEPYGFYHLSFNSPCKNAGDGYYTGAEETDIDNDDRDGDGYVDIGADEVTCEDVSDPNDWNADGIINLAEFEIFSLAWLAEPNETNWDERCDTNGDGDIDIYDFRYFVTNWLWTACWHENYQQIWMMSSGGGEGFLLGESLSAVETQEIVVVEKSVEEQLADAKVIIEWLKEVSKEKDFFDYIDKETWSDFVDKIYDWLEILEFDVKSKE